MLALSRVTGPSVEPISIADLRDHLRITVSDDDAYLSRLAKVVRIRAEHATRRALITQVWDQQLDERPEGSFVLLQKAPLQEVVSVQYVDMAGSPQTWSSANYLVDAPEGDYAARGRLALRFACIWPVMQPVVNALTIRTRCGYGDAAADVPELLKQAMLLDAGTLYATRSSVLTGDRATSIRVESTSDDIYRSYRSW